MPEDIKPVEPVIQEIPKTKEDWAKLAKEDPTKWMSLTQERMDATVRESRETKEKLAAAEQREKNYQAELERLRNPQPVNTQDFPKQYGPGNYPKTEAEWDELALERPIFAVDLRNQYINDQKTYQQDFNNARVEGTKLVYKEHPEMFVAETDETGKIKKDGHGKPVLKINPDTGEPYFKSDTEKGQLWLQIYNENPRGWDSNKNTPTLIMAEMERRLRVKGASMVQGQNNIADDDQSGVAPQGVTPPKVSSLKFASAEEKAYLERAVARGTYKSLEEAVKWRDSAPQGYAEPNRTPDFSKR